MNSLREVIAALFHQKFYHGESTTANGGAVPKESRLENEDIARGTIYVGIRICTKYSFFVKPTVWAKGFVFAGIAVQKLAGL